MKKNRMMRLASTLLVAVLITTSTISGTYAKYVTAETAGDSARVAKWGVFFDLEGGPLFNTEYAKDDTSAEFAKMTTTVKSENTDNVVAPGTSGELISMRLTGKPEVSYEVTFDVDETHSETIFTSKYVKYTAMRAPIPTDIDDYYPVVFTVKFNDKTLARTADLDFVIDKINNLTFYYNVEDGKYYQGDDVVAKPVLTVDWEWAFDGEQTLKGITYDATTVDLADTTLGDLAAGVPGVSDKVGQYNLEVALSITATATQID